MKAVIFEVVPRDGAMPGYLDTAAKLRPLLDGIDGFFSIERFQSLHDPRKLLSLSYFKHAQAIEQWRNQQQHAAAQAQGRHHLFERYRIRTATIERERLFEP